MREFFSLITVVENIIVFLKRLVEVLVPDSPDRVSDLYSRQDLIVQKVFNGLIAAEEVNYQEEAEKEENLIIEQNPLAVKLEKAAEMHSVREQKGLMSGWLVRSGTQTNEQLRADEARLIV